MNLDELRTVQSKERRKDSLQQLRDSFYRDVASFIQDLKATRDRRAGQVDDPFGDTEVRRLSDELETAEEVAEAVYERRVGKVVKLASFAAADMPVDDEGMTTEERELFDDLVARISQNKQAVLDVLSGTAETVDTADAGSSVAGPTNPVASPTQQKAAAASQSTASDTSQPDQPAESTSPEADSVLAEAMGTDTSNSGSDSIADTATESATPSAKSDVDSESTEPSSPTAIPPQETEPEPDAVLGTSTDGGTTDVASSAHNGTTGRETTPPTGGEPPAPEVNADPVGNTNIAENNDRTTVRITKNVGDIFCADGREYTLQAEDVVTLPTTNAEPLVAKDAAQQLD